MFKSFFRDFFKSELKITLLLLLISILAYWEISLLQYSLHWDMLDVILPWRYHVGECLQNLYMPFWNPYQSAGYPIHADLQCPTWYPETILVGSVFGYSNITLHILFIIYIFISGYGTFKLARYFGADNLPAFIAGSALMLTGVFVSHAQHLFIIVSMAWMPWVILYYLKLSENPTDKRNIMIFSLFTFLLISGGYQAISIVMAYLLFIFFIFYCIRALIDKDYNRFFRIIRANLAWVLITTGLCLIIIASLRNVFDYVDRLSGISLEQALADPFGPRSLISLLAPFGVVKDPDFFGTDISISNLYMGIFMLGFFLAGLFIKLKAELKILLVFGFIILLASFGHHLPVREVLYKYFPLMDMFRIPGFLRVYIIIPVIVTGGLAINTAIKEPGKIRKWLIASFIVTGGSLLLLLSWSVLNISGESSVLMDPNIDFREKTESTSLYEHVLIHSIIQIILMTSFFLLFLRKKRLKLIIPIFILTEMFIAVQLNIMYTACSVDFHPLAIRAELKERPQGFPLPPPYEIAGNSDRAASFVPLWRNVNIFNKTVSFDAFTSFKLKGYKYLEDKVPLLKEAILRNQLVYLSDRIYDEDDHPPNGLKRFHPGDLFFNSADFEKITGKNLNSSPGDTAFLTGFNPNKITTYTKTRKQQVLTLLQSNYKGWKVFIDGKQVPHYTSNHLFMSVILPAGEHEITFEYRNPVVKATFIISYSILLIILVFLSLNYLKTIHKKPIKILLPAGVFVLILIAFVLFLNNLRRNRPGRIYHQYAEMAKDFAGNNKTETQTIFMVDNPALLETIIHKQDNRIKFTVYNHCSPAIITRFWHDLSKNPTDNLLFSRINTRFWPEISYILKDLHPGIKKVHSTPISTMMQLRGKPVKAEEYLYSSFNDFESERENWKGNIQFPDSTRAFSGKYSNRLDSANKFSYTLSIPRSDMTDRRKFIINMSAAVILSEKADAFIVLQTKRDNQTTGYYTRNIHEAITERNVWRKVFFSKHLRYKLKPEDQINIYIWNNSKGILWVDDFGVDVTLHDD